MPELAVYCGGIRPPAAPNERRLVLSTGAPERSPERVNLNFGRVTTHMVETLPERLADLLELAAYVYCADQCPDLA